MVAHNEIVAPLSSLGSGLAVLFGSSLVLHNSSFIENKLLGQTAVGGE